jgi:hypothetical protein
MISSTGSEIFVCTAPFLRKDVGSKIFLETFLKMYFENLPNAGKCTISPNECAENLVMREVYKEKEKNRSATNFEMSSFWKITLR